MKHMEGFSSELKLLLEEVLSAKICQDVVSCERESFTHKLPRKEAVETLPSTRQSLSAGRLCCPSAVQSQLPAPHNASCMGRSITVCQ